MNTNLLYSGTSGMVLPVPNKLLYPPDFQDKSRLTYYASLLNSLEINSSFYKVPMASTVAKWAAEVPADFRFTYKLWRDITHNKGLEFKPEDVTRFMQVINNAGDKKGCLLVQFPPSITMANKAQLQNLLSVINDNNNDWLLAVEFRHRSWYGEPVYELLQQYNAAFVNHDMPASAAPLIPLSDKFVYLRFHGPNGGYRGSYDDDVLYEYASYINEWQNEGRVVYVYFNNTMGDALNNLNTLRKFVAQQNDN